jgi:hypothetical protein
LPKELATANARRIIACINACEGVPTELLEDLETMDNAFGDIKKTFCARAPISTRDDCTGDSIVNKDKKI